MTTDDPRAEAERMFDLMQSQRRSTQSRLLRGYAVLLMVWAAAWAIGFTTLWFGQGIGGVDLIPAPVAWTVFGLCMVAAIVWSIVAGIRTGSGIRGRSRFQGALYGWSWTISMVGTWMLLFGVQRAGLSAELAALLYPGAFVLMVGVLYLAGGALWRAPVQYALGVVMIAVAVVATFVGAPVHYLVYAVVGPVAMLVVAILLVRGLLPVEPRREQTDD
ncbi:hypothetical protein IF188_18705 [Microbacterium sp. NEAU-LLC]|uniref:Uncharacterized protein n=1 Tax=Microbacterium helvum TaxID=2773713 RepID=A0ABR8NTE7_9MICO|nr:hypothetical protein [Microbacterium helvum]MBD3943727.1 hypothetical protein [Microbacterium helvum]